MEFAEIRDGLIRVLNQAGINRLEDDVAQNTWLNSAERAYERGESSFEVPGQFTRDGNPHTLYF